eukprot:1347046-Pleurochrysis_carterae.AAC.1
MRVTEQLPDAPYVKLRPTASRPRAGRSWHRTGAREHRTGVSWKVGPLAEVESAQDKMSPNCCLLRNR